MFNKYVEIYILNLVLSALHSVTTLLIEMLVEAARQV